MISSAQNPRIKWVHALQSSSKNRRQEKRFVVEGVRLVEEALASGWPADFILHTPELGERGQAVLEGFAGRGVPIEAVSEGAMRAASDTETPQGLLAVLHTHTLPLPPDLDFVFIPDQLRDPGNLGTVLRTAAAAGAGAVLIPPETVDPFSPKVLRAGMGAHFRLPIHSLDWTAIHAMLQNLHIYLAAAGGGQAHTQADFCAPLALIVGGEAAGASQQALGLPVTPVHIPMPGGVESLNAAIAAGILLFEGVRQRTTSNNK